MLKRVLIPFLSCIFFISVLGAKNIKNKAIAIVDNQTILMSDFNKIADPIIANYEVMLKTQGPMSEEDLKNLKKGIFEQIINEKLALKQAKAENIKVSRRQKDDAYNKVKKRFTTESEFLEELSKKGLTEEEFKSKLEEELQVIEVVNKEVSSKVVVPTDDEAEDYYNDNKSLMIDPEAVRARHILLKFDKAKGESATLKQAKKIKKEIDNGADFATMAREHSEDEWTVDSGGSLGLFIRGQMIPAFENVAFSMSVGEVSDPVKTQFGYHIILCQEKRMEQQKEFDEVLKNQLKEFLYKNRMKTAYQEWIEDLKTKSNIVIKHDVTQDLE
ncbi:MAG: hypothetical protein GY817_05630 [bacterium]|nr:hypothetical protein [bacterium]